MGVCKSRLNTPKVQFLWLSRRFKSIAMLLDRDCLALSKIKRVNLKVGSSALFHSSFLILCVAKGDLHIYWPAVRA